MICGFLNLQNSQKTKLRNDKSIKWERINYKIKNEKYRHKISEIKK